MKSKVLYIIIFLLSQILFSQTEKKYTYLSEEREGLFEVIYNEKVGFINKNEKIIIPFEYQVDTLDLKGTKYEIVEKPDGSKELQFSWSKQRRGFWDGLCAVVKNNKYGYINKKNKTVIPFIYDGADSFSNKNSIVIQGENYGVIDTKGNIIVNFIYDRLFRDDSNNRIFTIQNGEIIYLDLP